MHEGVRASQDLSRDTFVLSLFAFMLILLLLLGLWIL